MPFRKLQLAIVRHHWQSFQVPTITAVWHNMTTLWSMSVWPHHAILQAASLASSKAALTLVPLTIYWQFRKRPRKQLFADSCDCFVMHYMKMWLALQLLMLLLLLPERNAHMSVHMTAHNCKCCLLQRMKHYK